MPFARPTLTQLKQQVAQDIASALPGSNATLRFANLTILGVAFANLTQLEYGYLDYIAQQCNPFTATGEYLEAWAALKGVFRKASTRASGTVLFPCTTGQTIPAGSLVVRIDGVQYHTTADATQTGGFFFVAPNVLCDADPTGLTGAFGNCPSLTPTTLGNAIAGITSTGSSDLISGGSDIESDDSLRSRMLQAYQNPPGVGTPAQYVEWALDVAGVTRAWCNPNGMGSGTVVVYTMWDIAESGRGGFPTGVNGVATGETRDTPATLDLLAVANFIYTLQGATPLVYSAAPNADVVNFSIAGIADASTNTKDAIQAALTDLFTREATPLGGVISRLDMENAIASVPLTVGFSLTTPSGDHTSTVGNLPIAGSPVYT